MGIQTGETGVHHDVTMKKYRAFMGKFMIDYLIGD